MRNVLLCLLTAGLLTCCTKPKERIPPSMSMETSSGKMIVYQMMPRLFGNKNTTNKRFGSKEENGVGKFNDINAAALGGIKGMGVTHVWYTGIIEHTSLTDYTAYGILLDDPDIVKGIAGSPYAIKDYYDVDPDLAVDVLNRMAEFEQLVERTHDQGLKVIIDFVPNHVARAYKSDAKPPGVIDLGAKDDTSVSFSPNNNFYYLPGQSFTPPSDLRTASVEGFGKKDGNFEETPAKVTGNDQFTASPKLTDWYETVKLNYGVDIQNGRKTYFDPVPDTWMKMKDILLFWTDKKVDGFRCDMVEMVPVEFWSWVIPQIKVVNPDIVFVAEVYNPSEYRNYIDNGKFNYLYDKVQLYDSLRLLISGQRSTTGIDQIQQSNSGINGNMLHFLENHDEQRIASNFFAGDPWKAAPAMVISATIDRGPVMIYFGQEFGEPGLGNEGFQEDDGRTTIYDYWGVPQHQKWMNNGKFNGELLSLEEKQLHQFYTDLLNLAASSPAIVQGDYIDLTEYNINAGNFSEKIHAFLRYSGEERLLMVTNFSQVNQDIKVQIPKEAVSALSLDPNGIYIARDLLWREVEVGLSKDFMFEMKCKPYSSFIFKIK
ncbi:MAG: alpha-amylase family protein [Cyclobacteriaceae bacterium]|nr:alpha-amylase family protein [Cyclobacteriaceae bacterium]MDH4298360.1 alpha-amylase family protein [Cyclobacteriaceae bacterium]MDH5249109.1 alpha-amylase family protein [Cyclobacteriaceae bacterium]